MTKKALVRSDAEILQRISSLSESIHYPQKQRLIASLSFEYAKTWLRSSATESDWNKIRVGDQERLLLECNRFLSDAWRDANKCDPDNPKKVSRGAKMRRHMGHLCALVWLLGEQHGEFVDEVMATTHENLEWYGKLFLMRFSLLPEVDFEWIDHDDGAWWSPEAKKLPRSEALRYIEDEQRKQKRP